MCVMFCHYKLFSTSLNGGWIIDKGRACLSSATELYRLASDRDEKFIQTPPQCMCLVNRQNRQQPWCYGALCINSFVKIKQISLSVRLTHTHTCTPECQGGKNSSGSVLLDQSNGITVIMCSLVTSIHVHYATLKHRYTIVNHQSVYESFLNTKHWFAGCNISIYWSPGLTKLFLA